MTLTERGTHAQIDAAVDGFNGGEPELAIRTADSAAGMLVIEFMAPCAREHVIDHAYEPLGPLSLMRRGHTFVGRPAKTVPHPAPPRCTPHTQVVDQR